MGRIIQVFVGAVLVVACSSENQVTVVKAAPACTVGELTGVWRASYEVIDGTCGREPPPDEQVNLDAPPDAKQQSKCERLESGPSDDGCHLVVDFKCPTADESGGTQAWVGKLSQEGADKLVGEVTVEINHPRLGFCRGTVRATMTKQ